VLASHSEGLSNALLEYMAAGRPIVATAVGGNVELIEHGVHGLLVPPGNAEAAAEAIARLLADREFASALGSAARERAGEHYSTGAMLRRHDDFYTTLVHRD
jgi:glycosyltransferase involved in cell wall biosynthesis